MAVVKVTREVTLRSRCSFERGRAGSTISVQVEIVVNYNGRFHDRCTRVLMERGRTDRDAYRKVTVELRKLVLPETVDSNMCTM